MYLKKEVPQYLYEWTFFLIDRGNVQNHFSYDGRENERVKLLKNYLSYFFVKKKRSIDYFLEYVDIAFLTEVYEEAKYLAGEQIQINPSNFKTIENLAKSVKIEFLPHNKDV